jgi:hypothetical protein
MNYDLLLCQVEYPGHLPRILGREIFISFILMILQLLNSQRWTDCASVIRVLRSILCVKEVMFGNVEFMPRH